MFKYAPNLARRLGWEQMCCCFAAAGCWWLCPRGGTHTQEAHCQGGGGDSSSFLLIHFYKNKKKFPFADCDFSSVLSAITDGQCAQFRAGGVIPWRPGQGHVQSDVHVVGGEDQPVPGPQGEASDQMGQKKKQKLKSQGEFDHTLFVSVTQDELHHSTKSSMVIGLLDIYGFEVLQHNRYQWQLVKHSKVLKC